MRQSKSSKIFDLLTNKIFLSNDRIVHTNCNLSIISTELLTRMKATYKLIQGTFVWYLIVMKEECIILLANFNIVFKSKIWTILTQLITVISRATIRRSSCLSLTSCCQFRIWRDNFIILKRQNVRYFEMYAEMLVHLSIS